MITADQILAHAIGDYLLQSHWMASEKTKRSIAAFAHVATYGLPFLLLRPSVTAFAFIVVTHFVIDRWRLARYVVWIKNYVAPWSIQRCDSREVATGVVANLKAKYTVLFGGMRVAASPNPPWRECSGTGYPPDTPPWLAVWLLIIADNILHLICNGIALTYL